MTSETVSSLRALFAKILVITCFWLLTGGGAIAQQTRVSVGFEDGFLGEYANQAHAPTQAQTFATLGIQSAVISQLTDNGQFGGSQGNDFVVDVTMLYTNGSTSSFAAAVNWRDTQGSSVYGIGLIGTDSAGNPIADPADGSGYQLSTGLSKTYVFQFIGSPRAYQDTAVGAAEPSVSGNAATAGLLDALNAYLASSTPGTEPSPLTSTITAADIQIDADGVTTTLVTIQLKDVNGNNITIGGFPVTLATSAGVLIGSLQDNGDGTYTQLLQSSTTGETAILTGTLDADGAGGNPAAEINDDATVEFVPNSPEITGEKTVVLDDRDSSGGLSAGDVLVYTITATNTGNVTLTGVTVAQDTLLRADGSAPANAFGAGDFTTGDATTLAPGGSAVFTGSYTVAQADVDAGGLSNSARVAGTPSGGGTPVEDVTDNGDDSDGNTEDDTTVIAAPPPTPALELVLLEDIAPLSVIQPLIPGTSVIDMDGDGRVSPGDRIYYVYHVTNTGNVTLTGIGINDPDAVVTGGPIDLVPGQADTATFSGYQEITQADIAAGELANQATATGTSPAGKDDVSDVSDDVGPGSDATVTRLPAQAAPAPILPQIEESVREILEEDLEDTVRTQLTRFSSLSAAGLGRLREGEDLDADCGSQGEFDPDGSFLIEGTTLSTEVGSERVIRDCGRDLWIIRQFDLRYDHNDDLGHRFDLFFGEQRERFISDGQLRGWFWGTSASQTKVDSSQHSATGEILGFSGHVGVYGAERYESGLFLDFYGALSAGQKRYELKFDLSSDIEANGDYLYAALFAGVGLSGETKFEDWTVAPAIRLDVAHAFAGDASVSAQYASLPNYEENASIQLDDKAIVRLSAEVLFGNDPSFAGDGVGFWDKVGGQFVFAPRLFCDLMLDGGNTDCGLGGYLEYLEADDGSKDETAYRLDYERRSEGDYSIAGQISHRQRIVNGKGTFENALSISQDGAATVSSNVEIEF